MSKLDNILSDDLPVKHCCGQIGTDIEDAKPVIKNLMAEVIKTYYADGKDFLLQKVEEL